MIPTLTGVGRIIAPDWVGFGRSDKFADQDCYTFRMHYESMKKLIETLDLDGVTLVVHDWGGILGLALATDPQLTERFARLVILNTAVPTGDGPLSQGLYAWQANSAWQIPLLSPGLIVALAAQDLSLVEAYNAPFPDASFLAGALAFPQLVPTLPGDPAAHIMRRTVRKLSSWSRPALVMFSDGDDVLGFHDAHFRHLIPTAMDEPLIVIEGAGHFLQEQAGEQIAQHIVDFIKRHPP